MNKDNMMVIMSMMVICGSQPFGYDGWSVERSCYGKTSSFESPLRGISLSDGGDGDDDDDAWSYKKFV